MTKHWIRLALAATTLAAAPTLLSPTLFAQAISVNGGSIQGVISDPSGAAVSGASISVTGTDTGFKKELTTDKAGIYAIGPLNPGNYTVTISASGFQTLSVQTIVRTGTSTPGSFKLTVGQASTEISVTAGAVQVNSDQISVSDVITRQQIDSLPINGRNFLDVAGLEPGVILQDGQGFDPTKAGYSAISVGGVSGRVTRILLDGQDITDETVGTTIVNVTTGAINEFQLNRATQDVSGEVTSTGQVLVSTGSGTNSLHGQLFYNFQDHRVGFAKTTDGYDAPFQRNQFGGSIGGPIIKDKLFFFADSERIKQDQSASATSGSVFSGPGSITAQFPTYPVPFRDTFSVARLDYNGPFGGHYFARAFYEANAANANYNLLYSTYKNRDNVGGIAGGADFSHGHFTHSIRGSYEKFHNLLVDATVGNASIYNPNDGLELSDGTDGFYAGPNFLAPQGTFQTDKQLRYDGTWTKGRNSFKFGYSINRILGGGFASFFGAAPEVNFDSDQAIAGGNPGNPLTGYIPGVVVFGNGNGAFTEKPAFGLAGGGVHDWRESAYFADTIKVLPSLTVVAGLRWSVDTDRANQDLPAMTCASAIALGLNPGCTGSTSLLATFGSQYAGQVHQPYGNFGPQFGFNFSPGDRKMSIRGGIGIYYENDIFNNTGNARPGALSASGSYFGDAAICGGAGTAIPLPGGGSLSSVTVGGNTQTLAAVCQLPIGQAAPYLVAARTAYQAATAANSTSPNGSYYGNYLTTAESGAIYGAPYRTPYSLQVTGGFEREITKGGVLTINYIHNNNFKVPLSIDVNHDGAARTLNTTAAKAAIAATAAGFGCTGTTSASQVACSIGAGASMVDFANNGLDSGNTYLSGGLPAQFFGLTPNTGAAFAGLNPAYGYTQLVLPVGQSGYDAAQIVFKDVRQHPAPGILSANFQATYSLSRVVTDSGGGSDQFFNNAPYDIDNPKLYLGRNGIDHSNETSFGGGINLKYGASIGFTGHFFSAPPSTLSISNTGQPGEIFRSDVTGDGTVGDILPGTNPGDYMHRVKAGNLNQVITTYNNTQANTPTPAGAALINAGLFTQSQLYALGGLKPVLATNPYSVAYSNPAFRDFDARITWPIPLAKLREGVSVEPGISMYNVANMANFGSLSGALQSLNPTTGAGGSNTLTGGNTSAIQNGLRVQRGAGTFDQGAPRTTEFSLKLNF